MNKNYTLALALLTLLTVLSLAVNGVVIFGLLKMQRLALQAIADTRALVNDIGDEAFTYTIEVDQEIPIAANVPFHEELSIPINTTIPVNTTVVVPVDLGVTTYNIDVPISTVLPVDLDVTVPISESVDVVTTVPLRMDVPIEIPLSETPLEGYLEDLDAALADIETKLERPFSQ